jgi:hypothetical protein
LHRSSSANLLAANRNLLGQALQFPMPHSAASLPRLGRNSASFANEPRPLIDCSCDSLSVSTGFRRHSILFCLQANLFLPAQHFMLARRFADCLSAPAFSVADTILRQNSGGRIVSIAHFFSRCNLSQKFSDPTASFVSVLHPRLASPGSSLLTPVEQTHFLAIDHSTASFRPSKGLVTQPSSYKTTLQILLTQGRTP